MLGLGQAIRLARPASGYDDENPIKAGWGEKLASLAVAGVIVGMLGAAGIGLHNSIVAPAKEAVYQPLNVACGLAKDSTRYDDLRVEGHLAYGVLIKHPDQLKTVCRVLNESIDAAMKHPNYSENIHQKGRATADNEQIQALADSLGVSRWEASNVVIDNYRAQQAQQDQAAKVVPASTIATPAATDLSSGPSM